MSPRQPPEPAALTVLSTLAALVAVYAGLALVETGRAGAGLLAGVAFRRFEAVPPLYLVHAVQDGTPAGPFGWLMFVFGGPLVLLAVAFVLQALAGMLKSRGWPRSGSLALVLVALVWIPTLLVAGALRRADGGPVSDLYGALGDPLAGRWGALGLGVLTLWLAMGVGSRRAVSTGGTWMRADTVGFRRRLVRVVAAYPLAIATAYAAVLFGWMAPAWGVAWGILTFAFLVFRTT